VEKENPLNAKDYVFAASAENPETQFFDYVVLGYSYLTKDARGYTHLEMTSTLRYILENTVTYIKPLHQKGIKVLIEVRSGIYNDTNDEGVSAGFGTMDMASINEFTKELKLLVDQYGIDGFDFNDTGGGKNSYPPFTRNLKQFRNDLPLYPDNLFLDDNTPLSPAEINKVLWLEGGSNFSNLIQRTNEALKETYTSVWKNGSQETSETQSVDRIILVRNRNHGSHLLSQLRMAYMPDAYSGADPKVTGNLRFIVNDTPYNTETPHAPLWDETRGQDVGAEEAENVYIPFTVDLSAPKERTEAESLAKAFLGKDLDPNNLDSTNYSSYGALLFTGLQPVSEAAGTLSYINYFSREIFRRSVQLAPGAGDYRKTW
jgi:hypothetical protein